MHIIEKNPTRTFEAFGVKLEHKYNIFIKNNKKILIISDFLQIIVSSHFWGLKINYFSPYNGYLCLYGSSWEKVHLITYVDKKKHQFKKYVYQQDLIYFSSNRLLKTKKQLNYTKKLTLNSDQLVTFNLKNKYEYDFIPKDWGSYLSPSFFHRLKNFNLIPFFSHKNNEVYFVISNEINKFQKLVLSQNKNIYKPQLNKALKIRQ